MKTLKMKKNMYLFLPLLLIMLVSFLTMYNARYVSVTYNNHLNKQLLWYLLAFIISFLVYKSNKIKLLFRFSFLIYIFNILLLILVLFFGKEVNGARAWFRIGSISIQPSELMKLSYSLYLTTIISKYKHKNLKSDFKFLLKVIILFLIPSIFIFLEPDTGAIIFLFVITICMLFASEIKKRWFVFLFFFLLLLIGIFLFLFYFNQDLLIKLIGTSFFYRMDRLIEFDNMQLENALIAIGNAKFFGSGFKNISIYIPEAATDFAFALTISIFGFITGLLLIVCYFLLDYYFLKIVFHTKNKTTRLFTSGFIGVFIFSQIYNMLMNIGFMPIMGIPLPFLSYGGSTLIVYFLYGTIILYQTTKNI